MYVIKMALGGVSQNRGLIELINHLENKYNNNID